MYFWEYLKKKKKNTKSLFQSLFQLTPGGEKKKRSLFHHRELKCKVGSQTIAGVTGKFGLGVQNEVVKRLTLLPREHMGHSKHPNNTRDDFTHEHHQMVNTEIRLIIFFVAEDGEALCSQ